MRFKSYIEENIVSGDIASVGSSIGVSKKGTLKYSHYSDRIGKREWTYAINKVGARLNLIKIYRKKYPNTNVFVRIEDIREDH